MEVISAWELYLWTRLDSVKTLFEAFAILGGIVTLFAVIFYFIEDIDGYRLWHVTAGCFVWLFVFVVYICTPTQKELAMIYVLPKIANNQNIQQEASDIYKMAKDALSEYIGHDGKKD